jgi:DNA/RNA endonuclease YhcR with UshA esterase domain
MGGAPVPPVRVPLDPMHTKRLFARAALAAVVLLAAAGCREATAPAEVPSQVAVRAYIDVDGSGTFTTGDVPINGARVALQPVQGGSAAEATTDAEGLVRFADVRAGSYTATFVGDAPQSATLASAASVMVVAPFHGGEISAQIRFVYLPGSIRGVVFRNDGGAPGFDPGTDLPAPGVLVRLRWGTSATGTVTDSIRTDAVGAFGFDLVRPGDYTLEIVPLQGIEIVGGNTRAVTVRGVREPVQVPVLFTGSLLISIADALQRPLESGVTVRGVVTVGQGSFRTDNLYVQDPTGGVQVFGVPTAAGLAVGDSIEVNGRMSQFGGQRQIVSPSVERLGTGTVPAPRVVTGAQVNARTFEGQLARAANVAVVEVQTGTAATFNVTVEDGAGNRFVVRVSGAGTGLTRANFLVGQQYTVTGVLGSNNNIAQLLPRTAADMQASAISSAALVRQRAAAGDSSQVTVEGVVTVGTGVLGTTTTTSFYVQDATGGIMAFAPTGTVVTAGQRVRVTGVLGHFNRELQVGISASRAVVEVVGTGTVPSARVVTGAQVAARTFEGQLARVENVEVVTVAGGTGAAFDVDVRDPAGTTFRVRVSGAGTEVTRANFTVGQRYDMTGLLGSFTDIPQLKLRSAADVVLRP